MEFSSYALSDGDYVEWKQALKACQKAQGSVEPLRALVAKPKLLNWRNPVSGQTLLHELAAQGASEAILEDAVKLGCRRDLANAEGETADAVALRAQSRLSSDSAKMRRGLPNEGAPASAPVQRRRERSSRNLLNSGPVSRGISGMMESLRRLGPTPASPPRPRAEPVAPLLSQEEAEAGTSSTSLRASTSTVRRKAGKKMASYEVSELPQAQMLLNMDFTEEADLDLTTVERSIQGAYGGKARVQIDQVEDSAEPSAMSDGTRSRRQIVKARVMFENEGECRSWQQRSERSRAVQESVAASMQLRADAVQFDGAAEMDSCDAMTLKLDSDSSHILCGACLLYNDRKQCEKVVCFNDRSFCHRKVTSVRHSGDTMVDDKSVHTISIIMSKIPEEVTQLYFTICSCGPSDLSGFKSPSIMMYSNSQPDANLLEYSIEQAAQSASSVMARMIRRPVWSDGDKAAIAHSLRRLRMPLLCIDLCLAMANETSFSIQALGTEEWHLKGKVCSNYGICKALIEERLRDGTAFAPETACGQQGAARAGSSGSSS